MFPDLPLAGMTSTTLAAAVTLSRRGYGSCPPRPLLPSLGLRPPALPNFSTKGVALEVATPSMTSSPQVFPAGTFQIIFLASLAPVVRPPTDFFLFLDIHG